VKTAEYSKEVLFISKPQTCQRAKKK